MKADVGKLETTEHAGPSLKSTASAVAVVLALAGLSAFTLFSGPTKVQINTLSSTPTRISAPAGEHGQETEKDDQQ
jgi:hypothetical protein